MLRITVLIFSFFILSTQVYAFAPSVIDQEFAASFHSGYVAGKCGKNIEQLILRLRELGVDMQKTQVGVFTNRGYMFSTTYRRNSGPKLDQPLGDIKFAPGISNFYHHVVLMHDGRVFDYDFGNEARVVPMKEYIKTMFWDEPEVTEYTGLERLRDRLDYEITFVPALEYVETLSAGEAPKLDLSDYYDSLPAPEPKFY